MHAGTLVDWLTILLLALNAGFVWQYLQETKKIRSTSEAQLEAQIRPAIVVRVGRPLEELEFVNLGNGPALHVRISATERGSEGKPNLDRLCEDIDFIEAKGKRGGVGIWATLNLSSLSGTPPGGPASALNGRSLQCQYLSLSGRTYWTVVDFDHADNNKLIATRFYPN